MFSDGRCTVQGSDRGKCVQVLVTLPVACFDLPGPGKKDLDKAHDKERAGGLVLPQGLWLLPL